MKWNIENRYDNGFIEVSTDGQEWSTLDTVTAQSDWVTKQFDLSAVLAGSKSFQVRLRLSSDSSINREGLLIDDIMVVSAVD